MRFLGKTELPDMIILPESATADYLDSLHNTVVDLTPFIGTSRIRTDNLDYGNLYYPCYANGCHYFMAIGPHIMGESIIEILDENGKLLQTVKKT